MRKNVGKEKKDSGISEKGRRETPIVERYEYLSKYLMTSMTSRLVCIFNIPGRHSEHIVLSAPTSCGSTIHSFETLNSLTSGKSLIT
jgi:hypothetical protein